MKQHIEFDPFAPFVDPPHDEMEQLRQRCPVARTASGWFVADHASVKTVLKRVDGFSGSIVESEGFPPDEVALINLDEPEHGRLRRIINGAIAAHRTADMEPFVRDLAVRMVDAAVATSERDGEVELVDAFAAPIPVRVVARALGVPVSDFQQFQRWADELVARLYDRPPAPYSELHPEFAGYIQSLLDEITPSEEDRRDFLSRLRAAGLSDAAIRTHALHLIIAGNETTRSMLGNAAYRLATEPGLLAQVQADLDLVPALVEESLRFDPPIQAMVRTAAAPHSIGGSALQPGDPLVLGLGSANRDASVFECPNDFRLDRASTKDHLAFGAGPHVCPGAFLARLEGEVALGELVRRTSTIELAPGYQFDGNPMFWSRAPLTLRVRLTGRPEDRSV